MTAVRRWALTAVSTKTRQLVLVTVAGFVIGAGVTMLNPPRLVVALFALLTLVLVVALPNPTWARARLDEMRRGLR